MARFLIAKKELLVDEVRKRFSLTGVIPIGDFNLFVNGKGYQAFHVSELEHYFIFGNALYKDSLLNCSNIKEVFSEGNYSDLSGRFLLIKVLGKEISFVSSIFSSFPLFYCNKGNIFSSEQNILAAYYEREINTEALQEIALFHCNYATPLFKGIKQNSPSEIITFIGDEVIKVSYLSQIIRVKEGVTNNLAMEMLSERLEHLVKAYFLNKKALISYTGGRDSRFVLQLLNKLLPKESIEAFTVGYKDDIEYEVGSRFTRKNLIAHKLIKPTLLDKEKADKQVSTFFNVNFPAQYELDVVEYLKNSNSSGAVLNTAIPETLLCHMGYFDGYESAGINFVKNRKSVFSVDDIKGSKDITAKVYDSVNNHWENLRSSLPNESITNVFFELTTYQKKWVFNILRPFDVGSSTVCIFEDPVILSILASMDADSLKDDRFYNELMLHMFSNFGEVPTTRDLELKSLVTTSKRYLLKMPLLAIRSNIFAGSLSSLLDKNVSFMKSVLDKNEVKLDLIFSSKGIELLEKVYETKYLTSRLQKLSYRIKGKAFFKEYHYITPFIFIIMLNETKYAR